MTDSIRDQLNFPLTPESTGEMAALAAINDLCQTWDVMQDTGLPTPPSRLLHDIDCTVEVLTRLRAHISRMKSAPPSLRVLRGGAR